MLLTHETVLEINSVLMNQTICKRGKSEGDELQGKDVLQGMPVHQHTSEPEIMLLSHITPPKYLMTGLWIWRTKIPISKMQKNLIR